MTCTTPIPFGFHVGYFSVTNGWPGASGCGSGGAPRCLAAIYPYVFVATTNGIAVFEVSDPTGLMPPEVPISGVTFQVANVVQSGRRVYFIGSQLRGGQLPIAWVDVPANPFVTSFTATSVAVVLPPFACGADSCYYPTNDGSLFFVEVDVMSTTLAALVTPPIVDGTTLAPKPLNGIPAGAKVVAASGTRLVTYRWDGTFASFSFESGAATSNAQNSGEQIASAIGSVSSQNGFAQGDDGSVLWMAASSTATADAGSSVITSARMAWLVAGESSTSFDASDYVDVETYAPPLAVGQGRVGSMAWVDANTALVLAANSSDSSQTSVQVVSRTGGTLALVSGRRYVLNASVSDVDAVGSGGFGFVFARDLQNPTDAVIHVFAPSCN
jgi:hypothetical protein